MASMAPLTMPGSAAGSTTETTVRHRRAPSASLAWRRSSGTSFSISSVDRITIGNMSAPSASEPAKPE